MTFKPHRSAALEATTRRRAKPKANATTSAAIAQEQPAPPQHEPRPGKLDIIAGLLRRPEGATLAEVPDRLPGHEEGRDEVELHHLPDHLDRGLREVAEVQGGAGVVHHPGEPAQRCRLDEEAVHLCGIGHVGSHRPHGRTEGRRLLGDPGRRLRVHAVAEHHVVARAGEAAYDGRADPAGATGDQGQGTGWVGHHHSESSLLSMARRCSREQVSQNHWSRPRSTAEVQVSGGSSEVTVAPQKEQVTTRPA